MYTPFSGSVAKHLLSVGPKLIRTPLSLVPFKLKAELLSRLLQLVLKQQADDDELTFLSGRWVAINVEDMGLAFEVSFNEKWLVRPRGDAEVVFSGESKELILVAAAKEDPDTLFFQRRLSIEGDTELGLEVKNLLLSIEFESMPAPIRQSIETLAKTLQYLESEAQPQTA